MFQLQRDAKATLEALNESALSEDPFNEVFLKEHRDIQTRFDVVMRFDHLSSLSFLSYKLPELTSIQPSYAISRYTRFWIKGRLIPCF